jgi:N-formylglutamate amidohydrolase
MESAGASRVQAEAAVRASHTVVSPQDQTVPVVFASPHSGQEYPPEFFAMARLDPLMLRRSEDAFVEQLFRSAPDCGAPLLMALFPRVYIDPNREPFELDPAMFDAPLPAYVNTRSPRVAAGLGTIARVVASGEQIYRAPLRFAEVQQRIDTHYFPYHQRLEALIEATRQRFQGVLLIDCHSMPSVGGPMDSDPGSRRVDFVLGDCHGTACAPAITDLAENTLQQLGYSVRRNWPYAGGFTTRHYGRPREHRHALQIEVNRGLYLDEERIRPRDGFARLQRDIGVLVKALTQINIRILTAR